MKKMSVGEFRSRCLAVIDDINKTRESVLITRRGKPLAKLVPVDRVEINLIGRLEGIVKITGDIESPMEFLETWESAQ
jgi:prevent-host-death family protein